MYLARGPAYRDYYAGFAAAGLAEISCETCTAERVRFIGRLAALGRTNLPALRGTGEALVDGRGAERVARHILSPNELDTR